MNGFIKRHKISFALGVILVLVILNVYLYKNSQYLSSIKKDLKAANLRLNRDIRGSRLREAKYIRQIKAHNRTIEQLDKKILDIQIENSDLKNELMSLQQRAKLAEKHNRATVKDYKQRLSQLARDLDLTVKAADEMGKALDYFRNKSKTQADVIIRQELLFLECRDQLTLKEHKVDRLNVAMDRLDRYYKRKVLKKDSIKYTIGIIVGLVAGYFMFKNRN